MERRRGLVFQVCIRYLVLSTILHLLLAGFILFDRKQYFEKLSTKVSGLTPEVIDEMLRHVSGSFLMYSAAIILLLATLSYILTKKISAKLEEVSRGAERYAKGIFDARIPASSILELDRVVGALNSMAVQLDERIRTAKQQANEREAVLSSISDSVVAIDQKGNILTLNAAAAEMFQTEASRMRGRPLQELLASPELQSLVAELFRSEKAFREQLSLFVQDGKVFDVRGTVLRDAQEKGLGAVLVFHDISQLRRLESVRREFVANVSHELKTPVTAIQGFVETLQDGAIEDPQVRTQFLDIIRRQSVRLSEMLDDLLSLARIENAEVTKELERSSIRIPELFSAAYDLCESRAREKGIALEMKGTIDKEVFGDRALVEQALTNLIVNGIKYTNPGGKVSVSAVLDGDRVVLSVLDNGIGIAKHHFPRLFERFYRVDRSRSRHEGGSGLGLSIVKHTANVHGGNISVESEVGVGSCFRLSLPLAPYPQGGESLPGGLAPN